MEHEPWRRRRLTRSTRERMWAGVAGGLAEYFDVDPTLVRLMWIVATVVTAGLFVAVYFVMWVIMPLDGDPPGVWRAPDAAAPGATPAGGPEAPRQEPGWNEPAGGWRGYDDWYGYGLGYGYHHGRRKRSAGVVLIVLGLLFLSAQVGLFRWLNGGVGWAVVLIVLGLALLLRRHDWRM
jgi:phage shock protein C